MDIKKELKERIWNNIWFWRISAIVNWIFIIYIMYWFFTDLFPDYELMYNTLNELGLLLIRLKL